MVLQIGPRALEIAPTPLAIRDRVRAYVEAGCIDDVLLDVSAGQGRPIENLAAIEKVVRELRAAFPDLGIGLAGGLCAATLPAVLPLVREYDLSYDAERLLRDDADGGGNLVLGKAVAYFAADGGAACAT